MKPLPAQRYEYAEWLKAKVYIDYHVEAECDALQRRPAWWRPAGALLADIGHGEFDGAHLVSNFEMLNPGRNFSANITIFLLIRSPAATGSSNSSAGGAASIS